MSDKKIEFALKFDTSDFDKAAENIQKKLKSITAPVDLMRAQTQAAQVLGSRGIGGISTPTNYSQAAQTARRELDRAIKEEVKANEKLVKDSAARTKDAEQYKNQQNQVIKTLKDQESIIKNIDKVREPKKYEEAEKKISQSMKEQAQLAEKVGRIRETNARQAEVYRQRSEAIAGMDEARESLKPAGLKRLMDAYKGGGIRGLLSEGAGMAGRGISGMGGLAGLAGSAGSALVAGSELYRSYSRAPMETLSSTAGAVSGTLGRETKNVFGYRTAFETPFQEDKAKASKLASDVMESSKKADIASALGKIAIGAAAGFGVGGIPGAAVGAAGSTLAMSGQQRNLVLSSVPLIGNHFNDLYKAKQAEEYARNYQESYENIKNLSPFKKAGVERYENTFRENLTLQRRLGLGDEGFYGRAIPLDNTRANVPEGVTRGGLAAGIAGRSREQFGPFLPEQMEENNRSDTRSLFQKATGAGFTPEMAMDAAKEILAAGGSTRMARESTFALQSQRGADIQNAPQVLATLSRTMGGAGASEQGFIKILSEGMKQGLDDSRFAEEQMKFAQSVSDIAARSGASTAEDVGRISSRFGGFVAEKTTGGLEAAKGAYEEYQKMSSATEGPTGVMRAAGYLKDEKLKKLSTMTKQALLQIPEAEFNTSNPLVLLGAREAGVEPEEFVARNQSITKGSISRFKSHDEAVELLQKKGVDISRLREPDYVKNLDEESAKAASTVLSTERAQGGYKGVQEMLSFAQGVVGKPEVYGPAAGEEAVKAKIFGPAEGTGKVSDLTIKGQAADAELVNKNFNAMRTEMEGAAKAAAAYTDRVRELNRAMSEMMSNASKEGKSVDAAALMNMAKDMLSKGFSNQPQGSRVSK